MTETTTSFPERGHNRECLPKKKERNKENDGTDEGLGPQDTVISRFLDSQIINVPERLVDNIMVLSKAIS